MTLDDLAALRTFDPTGSRRTRVTGYGALTGVDVVDHAPGVRIYVRGDQVVLVSVGPDALPEGVDHAALRHWIGDEGEELRSRQAKTASMHVVPEAGVAWSEDDGDVGFLELFPPTTLDAYLETIYQEPPAFIQ